MTRLIIFAGAPRADSINWEVPLHDTFVPAISTFAGLSYEQQQCPSGGRRTRSRPTGTAATGETQHAQWRAIALDKRKQQQHLVRTGDTRPFGFFLRSSDLGNPGEMASFVFAPTAMGGGGGGGGGGGSMLPPETQPEAMSTAQASEDGEDDLRSQFYEHSLALHETSNLPCSLETTRFFGNGDDELSSAPDPESQSQQHRLSADDSQPQSLGYYSPAPSLDPVGAAPCRVTDLAAIPPPAKLSRQQLLAGAATVISVVAGILSLESHTVTTRFGPRALTEMVLGDETRAGFPITFWLPPPPRRRDEDGPTPRRSSRNNRSNSNNNSNRDSSSSNDSALGRSLHGLRRGDVVLVQGVQLGVFRDRVYGQSVRPGDQSYGTRVHLMYRGKDPRPAGVDGAEDGEVTGAARRGHYQLKDLAVQGPVHQQLEKTKKVRVWILEFLGVGERLKSKGWEEPPADTQ